MNPLEILIDEHEHIRRVLRLLDRYFYRATEDRTLETGKIKLIVDFLKGFADTCHHGKEEEMLFPAMIAAGIPDKGGPIPVMLHEHKLGRSYIAGMQSGLDNFTSDKEGSVAQIIQNGRAYITLLENHIEKENRILFPMAGRAIQSSDMEALSQRFEAFEMEERQSGRHQYYMELLASLEKSNS